jgi:hypothetical protein
MGGSAGSGLMSERSGSKFRRNDIPWPGFEPESSSFSLPQCMTSQVHPTPPSDRKLLLSIT